MKNFIVQDKKFYKRIFAIALPMAMQNLINVGVSLLDTIMLGQLGEVAMSASSLGGQVGFMCMIINMGLTAGAAVLTSQYWGKKDDESIRKVMAMTYKISIVISSGFMLLALLVPSQLMRIFSTDPAVISSGVTYLRIIAFTYIASGFTTCSLNLLRTVGTVKISLYIYGISFFVNVFFNYCFIFGHFGFPAMGVGGAALATVIARIVELVIICIFIFRHDDKICFSVQDFFKKTDLGILKVYLTYGAPVLFNEILWSIGSIMLSVIMGRLGKEFVAANSICSVVFQCTSVVNQGMGAAASVIAGNTIGEGKYKQAKDQSLTLFVISIGLGILTCLFTLLISQPFVSCYNITPSTFAIAIELLDVMAFLTIFQTISGINMFGTLRGGGDSKFVLFFDVSSMWLFSVPLGWLSGLVFHWPVWAICICLKSGDIFKSVGAIFRILSGKWIKDVTRTDSNVTVTDDQ